MPRKLTAFYLDQDLAEALQHVKERDGVNVSEQIRRGIRMWLDKKGLTSTGKHAAARPRGNRKV